jgi:hypothetical protein
MKHELGAPSFAGRKRSRIGVDGSFNQPESSKIVLGPSGEMYHLAERADREGVIAS